MKIAESFKPNRLFAKDRRGVALITVLTVMALTTILVLTFFSLATSEHRASYTYSHGLQAQQVGEQAVNMVIAQIREATVQTRTGVRAWASQPGAIRTWERNGSKGEAFKLYSDDTMKVGGSNWSDFQKDFSDAQSWSDRLDHFVDLNEPVIRGSKVYYPIVHPDAQVLPKWPRKLGADSDGVEGFRFNEDGNSISDLGPVGKRASGLNSAKSHVAMPVRWIYQLADGTLGVLADTSSGAGGFRFNRISGGGTPSARNPMVARFAFWADDETTKLNINTHAGGLAWDIPKAGGELDMNMGKYQPAQKEWQRYPGHPATTHLSPALAPGVLDIVNDRDAMEMLYRVVPRIVGGGSESGTRIINTRDPKEMNGLVPDTEPLFPSLDDVIMRADRSPHEFPDAKGNVIPPDEMSEYLERAKFFVTVNSRAPETNLFNRPRIAMWPIYHHDSKPKNQYDRYLSAFDRLIHYCASVGKSKGGTQYPRNEFIFKRERADSATHDYLAIERNRELYRYLIEMMEERIPGYGASFTQKFGSENTAQLATMIFDYIRSTNLHDDTLFRDFNEAFQKKNTNQFPTFTNPRDIDEKGFGHKGHGQVSPIRIDAEVGGFQVPTKGMGRFYSLAGADIHVACVGQTGGVPEQRYTGVSQYNRGIVEPASGTLYTNLPPLPPNANPGNPGSLPQWLRDLEMIDPDQYAAAFDEANWNWQLAFIDEGYRSAVLNNPTANKFQRHLITMDVCERIRLREGESLVQAAFLFNLFSPSIGWSSINPDLQIEIEKKSGLQFMSLDGNVDFLGFTNNYATGQDPDGVSNTFIWASNWAKPHRQGGARSWGGLLSFGYMMNGRQWLQENASQRHLWWQMSRPGTDWTLNQNIRSRLTPIDKGYNMIREGLAKVGGREFGANSIDDIAQAYRYDLVTYPFKIVAGQLSMSGGEVNFRIYNGGKHTEGSAERPDDFELVQDVTIEFPGFSVDAPVIVDGRRGHINEFTQLDNDTHNALELASLTADPGSIGPSPATKASLRPGTGRSAIPSVGDRLRNRNVGRMALLSNHWNAGDTYIRNGDVVQSIGIGHGDARFAAAKFKIVPDDKIFVPHREYGKVRMAHSLTNSMGVAMEGYNPGSGADKDFLIIPDLPSTPQNPPYRNVIPLAFVGEKKSKEVQLFGDFDNGAGTMIDGPYINKPDEGNVHSLKTRFTQEIVNYWESRRNYGEFPYFSHPDLAEAGGPSYFSPNRIISGPGMLGSLPTGLYPWQVNLDINYQPQPWQTLLFRPNVSGPDYVSHPGAVNPPDHLIMDLFWMPVVEPYAISEPLSTGGKINMNFQMLPFLHVHRDTALRGVFRSEFMLCIPNQWHHSYKHDHGRGRGYHWRDNPYGGALQGLRLRSAIVEDDTLAQFVERFGDGEDAFKSATEICEIHLVPEEVSRRLGQTRGTIGTFTPSVQQMRTGAYWKEHSLVGDNSRERPYTNIQTRLTTKSNTYMVHYRAQVIKQARRDGGDPDYAFWRPTTDSVQAEYRGSSVVERYINPNDEDMPDFARKGAGSVDEFYQFRVINPRRFAP